MHRQKIVARILLVCAVLLAQQTALAHDYWHATPKAAGAAKSFPAKGDKLCDLHDLLGTVLGVVNASAAVHEPILVPEISFQSVEQAWADSRQLATRSRGPPAIS